MSEERRGGREGGREGGGGDEAHWSVTRASTPESRAPWPNVSMNGSAHGLFSTRFCPCLNPALPFRSFSGASMICSFLPFGSSIVPTARPSFFPFATGAADDDAAAAPLPFGLAAGGLRFRGFSSSDDASSSSDSDVGAASSSSSSEPSSSSAYPSDSSSSESPPRPLRRASFASFAARPFDSERAFTAAPRDGRPPLGGSKSSSSSAAPPPSIASSSDSSSSSSSSDGSRATRLPVAFADGCGAFAFAFAVAGFFAAGASRRGDATRFDEPAPRDVDAFGAFFGAASKSSSSSIAPSSSDSSSSSSSSSEGGGAFAFAATAAAFFDTCFCRFFAGGASSGASAKAASAASISPASRSSPSPSSCWQNQIASSPSSLAGSHRVTVAQTPVVTRTRAPIHSWPEVCHSSSSDVHPSFPAFFFASLSCFASHTISPLPGARSRARTSSRSSASRLITSIAFSST